MYFEYLQVLKKSASDWIIGRIGRPRRVLIEPDLDMQDVFSLIPVEPNKKYGFRFNAQFETMAYHPQE